MIEKLSGMKTYLFCVGYGVLKILEQAHVLPLGPEALALFEAFLLAGAGISLRAGVQKAEDASKQATA